MSICPECGEKAATTDIFCSYCGITLAPMASGDADDLSVTIVSSPPDPVLSAKVPAAVEATAIPEDNPIPAPIPSPFSSAGGIDPFAAPADLKDEGSEPAISAAADPVPSEITAEPVSESELAVTWEPEPALESETKEASAVATEAQPQTSVGSQEPGVTEAAFTETAPEQISLPVLAEELPIPEVPDFAAIVSGVPKHEQDDLPDVSLEPETPMHEMAEPVSEIEPSPPEIAAQMPVEIESDSGSSLADLVLGDQLNDSLADLPEEMKTESEPIADAVPETAAANDLQENENLPLDPGVVPAGVFDAQSAAGHDPDSIKTLETPAPQFEDQPAARDLEAPVAAEPAGDVRPSTLPNIGNADTDGRKASKLNPLAEGTLLNNRYEIVRKIGGGGMGAVYLASDRNLGGILRAVKEMVQSYIESEQQEKAIADFQREAMILTNLEHPAIPTIYDYFYDDKEGRFYLVMKYISGGDLAARLRANPEGRLDEKTVTEWAIQVADVLEYLHQQDPVIVYRDLKPANIMIDGNTGRLMLIDFGIARSINKEEKGVTAVGTMGYAPPELFSGNVEPRSDIYSLGSTMFHLLTGADPQSNPLLIFDFQKNPRPRQINPQLSDQIEQVLMRSVEYNSDLRFKSALEMKRALEEHIVNLQAGKVSFGVKAAPSAIGFSEQLVFCGFCGKQIIASDVFCAFCGSQQPIAQQSFHQIPVKAAGVTAKLFVVLTNDLESAGFTLEKDDNLIGRRDPMSNIFPEVDLSKYDPQTKISRRHARIRLEGASFLLEDLGSSNGTILMSGAESARLLPHQQRLLTDGDRIRVGDTTLQFSIS